MLFHKLIQNGNRVQIPGGHFIPLRVQAPGPDLSVIADHQLIGKAVFQHIGIVIGIIVGKNQGLFAFRDVKCIPDHFRLTVLAGGFAPDVGDVHQHIVILIDALEDFIIFAHRHHIVINPVGLRVAVKGQFRVSDHGMKEEVLHNAVPGRVGHSIPHAALGHNGRVKNLVGFLLDS